MSQTQIQKIREPYFFLIDKPSGWTSFDVVNKVRGVLAARHSVPKKKVPVGHSGTLDPFATGLLLVFAGSETKKSDTFLKADKKYYTEIQFGVETDTGDCTGEVIHQKSSSLTAEEVREVAEFYLRNQYLQKPPMYSAKKIHGKKLYEYARQGIEVPREAKPRQIKDLKILEWDIKNQILSCEVLVSSGTYIRQWAVDCALLKNQYAHLVTLRRLQIGDYLVENASSIENTVRMLSADAQEQGA